MDEARRFLRYVLPGLAFILEIWLYLFIAGHDIAHKMLGFVSHGIAYPVLMFVVAGGIGYFLAVIYHTLYGFDCFASLGIDHRPVIKDVVNRGFIKLCLRNTNDNDLVSPERLTRKGAWCVLNSIWHTRTKSSKQIEGADIRVNNFIDIVHGLGATLVGSILAIPAWLILYFLPDVLFYWHIFTPRIEYIIVRFIIALIVSFVIYILFRINYKRTAKSCESFIDLVFFDTLQREKKNDIAYVSKNDIN